MTITYSDAILAQDAATAISKIGSKDGATLKRLAQIIRYCKRAVDAYNTRRELLLTSHAKHENGEMVVKTDDKGNQAAVIENEMVFAKEMNALLKDAVEIEGQPPRAFTWAELESFKELPPADVIERMGPFVTLDD